MRQKMFWFPTKKALRKYVQEEIASKRQMEEFTSFILTNLVWRYHYRYANFKIFPTRFRKGGFESGEFRTGYNFEAYFPKLDRWVNLSWNKCISGHSLEHNIAAAFRTAIEDIMKDYRDCHPVCERCQVAPAEEVDHVNPEFIVIQREARKLITEQELKEVREKLLNDPDYEFWISDNHSAIQYVINAHDTAVLQAVCRPCHLQNARERKEAA